MLNGMNPKILAVAIAIAAIGAVGMLTTTGFVQEAEANACNFNFKEFPPTLTGSCTNGKFETQPADDNFHTHTD